MKKVIIVRDQTVDEGTFGKLFVEDGWSCRTGEARPISPGTYRCKWAYNPQHGGGYEIVDVPGSVPFITAAYCGDEELGLRCDVANGIALGSDVGPLLGQLALLHSRNTIVAFFSHMGGMDFELLIEEEE